MPGKVHWNELMTRDAEGSKKFFGTVVGWTYDGMPNPNGGTYWIANAGGVPVAGLMPIDDPHFNEVKEGWINYIEVDDVDAQVKQVTAAGGKGMRPAFDVPNVGRIAIVLDTRGVPFGLMTPAY